MLYADNALTPTYPTPVTPVPDDDSTVITHKAPEPPQKSPAAIPVPDDSPTVILSAYKIPETLQDPAAAIPVPDDSPTIILPAYKTPGTPQKPTAIMTALDDSPTVRRPPLELAKLLQNPVSMPTPQLDPSINASTAPTMIIPGSNARHDHRKKKKNKKAHGHAKSFTQVTNALIEPFIPADQNEAVPPESVPPSDEYQPSFVTKTFPPVSLEGDDRILAQPYPGSSPRPMQLILESIHPAVLGLAAVILVVFLSVFWWWNSGETALFPEDIDESAMLSSESLSDTESSLSLSTPVSPVENTSAFDAKQRSGLGPEPGLMSIPSLPMNQRQGRHNQYNPAEIKDAPPFPSHPPEPAQPALPQEEQGPTATVPPEPAVARTRMTATPAPAPVTTNSSSTTPSWLKQMRSDLSDCQNFFCREKVRNQYCTAQRKTLPECKGASL